MKKYLVLVACTGLLFVSVSVMGQETKEGTKQSASETGVADGNAATSLTAVPEGKFVPVEKYDPKRDAGLDIKSALSEAKRTNKRVLLEVGGLWCVWCRHLDNFFSRQSAVLAYREKYFVMVKINFSPENENKEVIERYGKIEGYPHIFVLDSDGTLLHSQNTGDLEEGKGYNIAKVSEFLKKWSAASPERAGN